MNRLDSLHEVTVQLHEVVTQQVSGENRQEQIDRVNQLLDERQQVLLKIKPPYTEAEKVVGQRLLPINKVIQQKLEVLFNQVKADMGTVKKKKSSNAKYTNPYKNVSSYDGMFLDHKK